MIYLRVLHVREEMLKITSSTKNKNLNLFWFTSHVLVCEWQAGKNHLGKKLKKTEKTDDARIRKLH